MAATMLVVDPNAGRRTEMRALLAADSAWLATVAVKEAADRTVAELLAAGGAQLVVCATALAPDDDGADACRWAAALTGATCPVVMIAEAGAGGQAREALYEAGAADVIGWPVGGRELAARLGAPLRARHLAEQLAQLTQAQAHLGSHDALTGLFNREHFLSLCRRSLAGDRRNVRPTSLCLIALDGLRQLNAQLGPSDADALIAAVGGRLEANLREDDVLGRLGPAQFGALLPQTDLAAGQKVCERLRRSLAGLACGDLAPGAITLSLGLVASGVQAPRSLDELLADGEDALQRARRAGGNQLHA